MTNQPLSNVTEAELAVLEFLWGFGPATKRQVTAELYARQSDSDFATVQKLLERLEAKGFLQRDRSQFAHLFQATCSKQQFLGQQIEAVAGKLSGGSLMPVLMHLVGSEKLSKKERDRIRKMLDEADQ